MAAAKHSVTPENSGPIRVIAWTIPCSPQPNARVALVPCAAGHKYEDMPYAVGTWSTIERLCFEGPVAFDPGQNITVLASIRSAAVKLNSFEIGWPVFGAASMPRPFLFGVTLDADALPAAAIDTHAGMILSVRAQGREEDVKLLESASGVRLHRREVPHINHAPNGHETCDALLKVSERLSGADRVYQVARDLCNGLVKCGSLRNCRLSFKWQIPESLLARESIIIMFPQLHPAAAERLTIKITVLSSNEYGTYPGRNHGIPSISENVAPCHLCHFARLCRHMFRCVPPAPSSNRGVVRDGGPPASVAAAAGDLSLDQTCSRSDGFHTR
ncbi:MAG: hypothetical protein KC983_00800 [Phycisphaerales bacterium]|nr:hypothetical protein [Phycisphaerales bacterium]